MRREHGLIGRERELVELDRAVAAARAGRGSLFLVTGDAGIGKTRLVDEVLGASDLPVIRGLALREGALPYSLLAEVFRHFSRTSGRDLRDSGPLAAQLALLLPELGPAPEAGEQAHVVEAMRQAFAFIASQAPTAVFLDDLHWADSTTLDVLPALVMALSGDPLLVVGAYRSDELGRGHPLRRMRTELRRCGLLREVALEPLDQDATALLVAHILGHAPDTALAAEIYARTQGIPFYVEELTVALRASDRLRLGPEGMRLTGERALPLPESVRDTVLLRTAQLSDAARGALEVAAVIGQQVAIDLVDGLADLAGLEEALAAGLLIEAVPGQVAFRHALVRDALASDIPWTRRRLLHRRVAERLATAGAPALVLAEHWLAAREPANARPMLVDATVAFCAVHAYRDALATGTRALDIWPDGDDESARLAILDRLGSCAQLAGDVAEATRFWREAADGRRLLGEHRALAETQQRLATAYELQGAWDRALEARHTAAEAYVAAGMPAEAAIEYLVIGGMLQQADRFQRALTAAAHAVQAATESKRTDLIARAYGLEGQLRVKLGDQGGTERVREGLSLALAQSQSSVVPELYFRLASAMEHLAQYEAARDAYGTALNFCEMHGMPGFATVCLGCLANLLYETGEWDEGERLCRELLANPESTRMARLVGSQTLGLIRLGRGDLRSARTLAIESERESHRLDYVLGTLLNHIVLAQIDMLEGQGEAAATRCQAVLGRWRETDERHYMIPALRWMTECFTAQGNARDAHACASALSDMATVTGETEALAALAAALGEIALLEGNAGQAAQHLRHALELLRRVEIPYDRAQLQVRAGIALAAAGERESAIEQLVEGYRGARRLGAKLLAQQATQALAALGERVERRLGRRAIGQVEQAGLSRRELEVLRLIAAGRTNREIGADLFLSPRTVDMHVGKILAKLDCRSRAEATRRAIELGLVTPARLGSGARTTS